MEAKKYFLKNDKIGTELLKIHTEDFYCCLSSEDSSIPENSTISTQLVSDTSDKCLEIITKDEFACSKKENVEISQEKGKEANKSVMDGNMIPSSTYKPIPLGDAYQTRIPKFFQANEEEPELGLLKWDPTILPFDAGINNTIFYSLIQKFKERLTSYSVCLYFTSQGSMFV
jgi:hypothetical protein